MKKTAFLKATLLSSLVLGSLSAQAHRAWITPDVTVLSGDTPAVTFDMAVSNSIFNFDHVPMRSSGLHITDPNGQAVNAENLHTGKYRTVFDLTLETEGTYRVFIANQGLFARWENAEGKRQYYPKRGQTYDKKEFNQVVPKKAKDLSIAQTSRRLETFVTSGAPTDNALEISNKGLELKPITHPNDLYAGETAQFQFFIDGKPAQGVEVSLIREGTRYRNDQEEITLTSNKKGEVSVDWNGAGRYFLEASYQDDQANKPATVRRGNYSLVLEVLPD